jgi:hypothetical protein
MNYNYRRVEKGEPDYERIQQLKNRAIWVCDSYDHNESNGCSNPDCFKHSDWKGRVWNPPPVLGEI